MATLRADRRLYVTADRSRVCEEGDADSAFLLAGRAGLISPENVAKYRLAMQGGKVVVPGREPDPEPPQIDVTNHGDEETATLDGPTPSEEVETWPFKMEPAQYIAMNEDSDSEAVQEKVALARRVLAVQEG